MAPDPAAPQLPPPWGHYGLPEDGTLGVRLGSRDLWLRWRDGEVRVAGEDRGPGSGDLGSWGYGSPAAEPPGNPEWSRWATPAGEREVLFRPTFPDRAVVLEPEWPFRLLPRAQARIFVRVPLWIRIELSRSPEEAGGDVGSSPLLDAVPTVEMSDTWWGDLLQGELAYWLPTTARRSMSPGLFAPHVAVCPLLVRNEADSDLRVEKIALRVAHLSLFREGDRIWADESRVTYQGHEEGSRIEMAGWPPEEAEEAQLIAGPRIPVQKGLRARTFDRLKALPGMGGYL